MTPGVADPAALSVAPCCFSQQVSVHPSAAAQEVKRDVRRPLAAGETQQQILDAYVAQYGKHILAEPRAEGFDLGIDAYRALAPLAAWLMHAASSGSR